VQRNKLLAGRTFAGLSAAAVVGLTLIALAAGSLQAGDNPPVRVPSYVSWTLETTVAASSGDAFRGMLLAKRCEHCHGAEGFSAVASTPNLAGMVKLTTWKQLRDFQTHKRVSRVMNPITETLSPRDLADLAAYYSKLPIFTDPQDNRAFPQAAPGSTHAAMASWMVSFGDGERGIPPCQACHGPVAYRPGVPSLATQNAEYILNQLEAFANQSRTNDINEPMRTIAALLTEDERHAIAEYYGSGSGFDPGSLK
jgi:cytochrome c553